MTEGGKDWKGLVNNMCYYVLTVSKENGLGVKLESTQ